MEQAPIPQTGHETFRAIEAGDVSELVALGARFFAESEFPAFSTFNPEAFEAVLRHSVGNPAFQTLVFLPETAIEGFIAFQIEAAYTVEPLALVFLFYVSPAHRKSPAGRILLETAMLSAKDCGAVAFYGGVMSGIEAVTKTMPNLYGKLGFEPLWWGRKVL